MVVDRGSDYVATYMQSKLTLRQGKGDKIRDDKWKKEN